MLHSFCTRHHGNGLFIVSPLQNDLDQSLGTVSFPPGNHFVQVQFAIDGFDATAAVYSDSNVCINVSTGTISFTR